MLKRSIMAAVAAALAVLAMPALASAGWLHSGVEMKAGQNASLASLGSFSFQGELGGVECETISSFTLTGGQTTGEVTKFEPNGTATAKCKTTGVYPLVGCTKVEKVNNTDLPWTMHRINGFPKIQITTGVMHFTLFNAAQEEHCIIPQITLEPGSITIDVAAAEQGAISKYQFSRELETSEGEKVEVKGAQSVAPAGTYGMTP